MTSERPAGRPDPAPPVAESTPAAGGVIVIHEYGVYVTCSCGAYRDPLQPCGRCGR